MPFYLSTTSPQATKALKELFGHAQLGYLGHLAGLIENAL